MSVVTSSLELLVAMVLYLALVLSNCWVKGKEGKGYREGGREGGREGLEREREREREGQREGGREEGGLEVLAL